MTLSPEAKTKATEAKSPGHEFHSKKSSSSTGFSDWKDMASANMTTRWHPKNSLGRPVTPHKETSRIGWRRSRGLLAGRGGGTSCSLPQAPAPL